MKYIPLILILAAACSKKVQQMPPRLPAVEVASVIQKTIPIELKAIGHVTAYNSAEIKAQVEGRLLELHFTEGTNVNSGDLLFTIDPRPYEAQLAEAVANLQVNVANANFAQDKVNRYRTLVDNNYVSKLDFDQYNKDFAVFTAMIAENQAAIDLAKVNLSYCYITAPFSGRVGKRLVDMGNLIANDGSTLLTLNQLQPILVDFSLPEKNFSQIQQYQSQTSLKVKAQIPERKEPFYGTLTVIDNNIRQNTGMIGLRAQFDNEEELLWPGQFVRTTLVLYEEQNALLVPTSTLTMGQKGQYVYVVRDDSTVEVKYVQTGEIFQDTTQITQGLTGSETLITTGKLGVVPGQKVNVVKKPEKTGGNT